MYKKSLILLNTEAKQNFAKHSALSVETKDKVDRLKVLRNISTLVGYMIDTYRKSLFQKVQLRPVPVTV